MGSFEFDLDSAINELDRVANALPEAIPDALNAMADVVVPRLQEAAPVDNMNSYDDHLKDLIGKVKVKTSRNGTQYIVIKLKKRGENDKHIYKAVIAEYGRGEGRTKDGKKISAIPAKRFWSRTVLDYYGEAVKAGTKVIDEAIEKAKKG